MEKVIAPIEQKQKNNYFKIIANIIIFVIIIAISLTTFSSYGLFNSYMDKSIRKRTGEYYFVDNYINTQILATYYMMLQEDAKDKGEMFRRKSLIDSFNPSNDVIYSQENDIVTSSYEDPYKDSNDLSTTPIETPQEITLSDSLGILENEFNRCVSYSNSFTNLQYYCKDTITGKEMYNNDSAKKYYQLFSTKDKIDVLENPYLLVKIEFNAQGDMVVDDRYINSDYNRFVNNIQNSFDNFYYEMQQLGINMKKIANKEFVFAIPTQLQNNDSIFDELQNNWMFTEIMSLVLAFVLIALMLLSMLIPHKWLSWFKIPYEISLSICISVALFSFFGAPQFILDYLVSKNDFILELTMGNAKIADILIKTSHIIMWIIYYANAILTGFLLKSLFKKEYLKKTSLIYRFCHFVKTKYNRMIDKVIGIDISSNLTKIVVGFTVVNGIIVSLCCAGWFFGILGVVIYSIVLFFLGCKFIKSIRDRYNKVLDITKEIADGNLTVDTSEDLKNFNSLKDNLAKIQVGLKKSVKEAVESQKMKTDLITNVSHDLKTPLTSIISYVDLLKDENLSKEKRKEYIDILDKKAERLNILINDLFEASKASSGNVNLNIEKIDIVALIKQTINELEDKLQEIEIKTTFCDEKIILDLDSVCTFRIFSNLINNIAKYSLPNTRAYIDVTQDNEQVTITLKNISRDELNFDTNAITERFVRGDSSRNTQGSGLGLAIAKNFTVLQNGEFDVSVDGDLFKIIISFKK